VTLSTDGHQWISLTDGSGSTWIFDADFLTSSYTCIYGQGCPSNRSEPDPTGALGCCSHGAHFVDDEDLDLVLTSSSRLEADEWHYKDRADKRGGPVKKLSKSARTTRIVNGSCIFLNPPTHSSGGGCALHTAALKRNERPVDWKPAVCWQLPLRLDVHEDEYGYETVLVRAWQRRDWGPGGDEFHWWCTESELAYVGSEPLYRSVSDELTELIGDEMYNQLAALLDSRVNPVPVQLRSANDSSRQ